MNQIAQISTVAEIKMANAIRALTMDAVQAANSGHPGMPMGMADVAAVLFHRFIVLDPAKPNWPDRDRFVLSAGHGSMLLYAINHLLGYDDMGIDQIKAFRQIGSRTAGHPEYGHADGIEVTTGPLGQGISTAVGLALAERMHNARFGNDLVGHYTYVIAGDGCLMEGVSQEAIDMAGHMGLGRLIVFWDDNKITIDGSTDLSTSTNQRARFTASDWQVLKVSGHCAEEIADAITEAQNDPRPTLIDCETVIGFGAPNKQGTAATHGAPLGEEEIAAARVMLDWPHAAFHIPDDVYTLWRSVAERGAKIRRDWQERLDRDVNRKTFNSSLAAPDASALNKAITDYKKQLSRDLPKIATRKASEMVLEVINRTIPNSIGGSADLTGSNLTRTENMRVIAKNDYDGDYIFYGIREHGMAAAMNGIALHGGFRPYGGTFLAFADYCRPSIRLAALMGVPVTYVFTHDSIGLGEDGPTHQPVEQIASLRAMPNLAVIRPADAVETAEAWQIATTSKTTPTALCLSRQELPTLRDRHHEQNLTARGAYVLREPNGQRDVTLIATGSEVEIAMVAASALEKDGLRTAVVSAPCFELFAGQDEAYRKAVLGQAPRVGIEAALQQGWGAILGAKSAFVGMTGFGASAPADALFVHFGITSKRIAQVAKTIIHSEG